jgi:diphosphomevalonate decarboxylase
MNYVNTSAQCNWQSPSNIALVKYWGKRGEQLPANPSISFTLDQALTETSIRAEWKENQNGISIDFYFEQEKNEAFAVKLEGFLEKAARQFPFLHHYHLIIHSSNTFPHSSGIASSASAYSALALCLCSLHEELTGVKLADFYQTASYWARIGSGSACRSVYGGYNVWGKTASLSLSSDEYAINIDDRIHADFKEFSDTVLIIEKGKKAVSSTLGHALLKEHPFAETRYKMGYENTERLLNILAAGELQEFIQMVESEALMLHALMMTSASPFILMKPNTLAVIEKIWDFRRQTGTGLLFTLDAGANVHLLYPTSKHAQAQEFVKNELLGYCQNDLYFCNAIGKGPVKK